MPSSVSVLVIASPSHPSLPRTRQSLEAHTDDVIVTTAPDTALALTRHAHVLVLSPGETVDPSAWPSIDAFTTGDSDLGVVCVVRPRGEDLVREVTPRLVRRAGARFEAERPLHDSNRTHLTSVIVHGTPEALDVDALRAQVTRRPEDPWARYRLARAVVTTHPEEAVELANAALEAMPIDAPDTQGVVLTLAEGLFHAKAWVSLLGLAEACRERYPRFTELRLLEALARGELGRSQEMLATLEACIGLGEDTSGPGRIGAGSMLPWFHLGAFAEKAGDRASARTFYARGLPLDRARGAIERLDREAAGRAPVPPRLVDGAAVAMKACRHGALMYPKNDTFIGKSLDLYGEWCEAELETLGPLVSRGDVVVDIGANVGSHTVFFAKAVGPEGKVVALEPQRFLHGLLSANVAANGFANVECRRVAASDACGEVTMPIVDPTTATNFGAVGVDGADAGATERVEATTVDALDLAGCALLKIDVEGFEPRVLAGAKETIRKHRPIIFVENNTVERSAEVIRAVRELGYRAYWHIAPYYSSDNFFRNPHDIFAIYQPEANLVCVPADRELAGMLEVTGDDDDFVKALARAGATETRTVPPRRARVVAIPVSPPLAATTPTPTPAAARPLTIVACIPGREFSGRFFDAWNEFAERCRAIGIRLLVSRQYDAVVYYARNRVAGGDVRRGPKQAPWGGEVDYDYMLWIDSDVVFRFEDFQALLAHKVDLVAGLYLMADNVHYAAVEHMEEERFRREGAFEFLTPEALSPRTGLVPVDYCGFGFVLARKGVFEKLEYPWFRPIFVEMQGCTEFTSEDVGFCMLAKKAGIPMLVDPRVVVGHEKAVVLAPKKAA